MVIQDHAQKRRRAEYDHVDDNGDRLTYKVPLGNRDMWGDGDNFIQFASNMILTAAGQLIRNLRGRTDDRPKAAQLQL